MILLALRDELGTSLPTAESILATRKEESVAGDAKGEEGRGTWGGSRYVEIVCGVSSTLPLGSDWTTTGISGTSGGGGGGAAWLSRRKLPLVLYDCGLGRTTDDASASAALLVEFGVEGPE